MDRASLPDSSLAPQTGGTKSVGSYLASCSRNPLRSTMWKWLVPVRYHTIRDTEMTHEIAPSQDGVFSFGNFELVPKRRLLSRDGKPVRIGSRALDLLVALVEDAGTVITKHDLISRVWGTVIVEDTNLRVHISVLRRVLGDDGFENRFIVHVARRGYIFVAPLEHLVADRIASPLPDRRPYSALGPSTARHAVG